MSSPITQLDRTERILLGVGVVAWLGALGAAVAAVVALVDLARGDSSDSQAADTPWLLYVVIGISVVVIIAAVPLLLRARAQADTRQPVRSPARRPSRFGYDRAAAAVEEVWLRFTLAITCAIGVATAAIGLATYLMATDNEVAAWCCYGVAGLLTVGMIALPVVALRQLDQVTA